ncbi:MAG: glycerol-3-phosphate 1-O-acyltransferase PlsY [Pseudomonadota bacterium]|jgi:acyl phosphate:glycerol-3-phosphate acyltransferase
MMENSLPYLVTLAAYLIGSLSFAVVISRLMGLNDPRTYGSKNPGATNVLRSGNKIAAVLTLLLDALKGWLPVYLVKVHGADWGLGESTLAWVFLAAFLGHLFPVFFRFKGGKGVATAAGVLIALEPTLALAILASWLIVVYFSRMVSLASIVAALFAPVYYLFGDGVAWSAPGAQVLAVAVMGLLLIWRHAENIGRIVAGSESRLGAKKP